MTQNHSLGRLLHPRSVAVVGASDDALRIGGRPIAYMQSQGYQGRLLPVNPNRPQIQGLPAYASVAALPETPDVAIVAVAAKLAPQVVADLGARGTAAAVVFSAGFAEMGEEGAQLQQQMLDAARASGIRLLGPNSLGVLNPRIGFYGSFTSVVEMGFPKAGRVGIASQSGAYGSHILGLAREFGIGVSSCVMSGNECDISLGELVHAFVEDEDTDVITVYSEGIRDGDRLLAALEAARRARKPVVMMKVGTSVVGSAAAQSHTASIAGNDAVTHAVLAEFGVVRARSTEHMLDVARLATRRIYPANNTLGVITVSGGAGVIVSDAAELAGLPMPEMPADAQRHLKELIPFAAPRNPVDCTAQFMNDLSIAGRFTEAVVEEGGYQSILGFFTYTVGADSIAEGLRAQLKTVRDKHPDRLFVLSILASKERVQQYDVDGFTVFEDPARAVAAIEAMGRFGHAFARQAGLPPPSVPRVALPASTPSEAEAKRVLAEAGIAVAPERACATADAAVVAAGALGFPVVLKILSPDILHKSEIGGVLLNVASAGAVRDGFATLIERAKQAVPEARIEGVLVAKQLSGGVECILGIQRDPVFGPVAMFGLGGIFVEVMKDVVLQLCPFGEDVAETMIRSIQGAPLLLGARGKPPVDVKALAVMLSRLSVFAHQAGERLQSIDLNPVFALPAGQGAYAADAVIEVLPTPAPLPAGPVEAVAA
ncbi:acyl-CoA synthetase (NDP forming) [Variovorax paradoxus]|uniref:Acyl-CoA synthetase (NDP forming) n=1 Tax=Variovorax paradoxus TaxID=34073 RepID=A0AAE3Y2S0_VARPD|nr:MULTISPECIES: acetate--CoA ligase family protein [Variovorax]MBD9665267.1 acetate--CoA ligase family protein [Variovorax sp. VRV01]MDP9967056.1 acyl-CoA synthetase (NDP forming) [Variovorax paradoxus]MDR6429534.1 acyl-CoA synthetase (NDP forming) [Variovorax paradoxus]